MFRRGAKAIEYITSAESVTLSAFDGEGEMGKNLVPRDAAGDGIATSSRARGSAQSEAAAAAEDDDNCSIEWELFGEAIG